MAESKPALAIVVSRAAFADLEEIWQYNAEHRSVSQADRWDAFLKQSIYSLAHTYDDGQQVLNFPELRSLLCKKGRKGDGHYLIYEVDEAERRLTIIHVFHTKMDVTGRLEREF